MTIGQIEMQRLNARYARNEKGEHDTEFASEPASIHRVERNCDAAHATERSSNCDSGSCNTSPARIALCCCCCLFEARHRHGAIAGRNSAVRRAKAAIPLNKRRSARRSEGSAARAARLSIGRAKSVASDVGGGCCSSARDELGDVLTQTRASVRESDQRSDRRKWGTLSCVAFTRIEAESKLESRRVPPSAV